MKTHTSTPFGKKIGVLRGQTSFLKYSPIWVKTLAEEGKEQWKPRWCILKKQSPVADRLQVILYKDVTESRKAEAKPKDIFALDGFIGLNAGFCYDRESYVMAILCHKSVSLMAFECRDDMIKFEINIRQSFGEEHQFPVRVVKAPSSCRFPKDQVSLIIHDCRLCLVVLSPPKILMIWNIDDLRRFGVQNGKFCFEGGERCGKGSGVFAFQSEQSEDIADIVHLASTGKTSNCHRKFKNRSSQIDFGNHLIPDLSSSSTSHLHYSNLNSSGLKNPVQSTLPVNLNCCNDNQSNSAESEDWSWYKRHSVSVMDHHRIAALRESQHTDNRDQISTGIYDVPPNNRLVEEHTQNVIGEPLYDSPRPDPVPISSSSLNLKTKTETSVGTNSDYHGLYKKIVPQNKVCGSSSCSEQNGRNRTKYQSTDADPFIYISNVAESPFKNQHVDESSHEASLQRLKKQESDLQREMVLLDEMLLNCSTKSQNIASQSFDLGTSSLKTYPCQQNSSQVEPEPLDQSVLSALDNDFLIISGNVAPVKPQNKTSPLNSLDKKFALRLNTSLPENSSISPLFHAKLNKIPMASGLNKPLPYVNLSKYDDESYSHVHLPGSADQVPSRIEELIGTQGHLGIKAHSSSLSSLHVAPNLNRLNPPNQVPCFEALSSKLSSFHKPRQNRHHHSKMNTVQELQEMLVVNLNGDSCVSEETVYATIQSSANCEKKNTLSTMNSEILDILTSDVQNQQDVSFSGTVIYENIPARREETPPPQLPPKGPALLKKIEKDWHTKKFENGQNKNLVISNISQCDNPEPIVKEEGVDGKMAVEESNYLMMGSPKLKSKHLVDPNSTSKAPTQTKRFETRISMRKDDYMDMASFSADSFHEDEIYLDGAESEVAEKRDLYISEADLLLPLKNNSCIQKGESTYMDMSTISTRRTPAAQSVETSEGYNDMHPPILPPPNEASLPSKPHQSLYIGSASLNCDEMPAKKSSRVYVKAKSTPVQNQNASGQEPPKPFPNLIDFSKKMSDSKSTYINTTLDSDSNLVPQETYISREVLLPEPVKEGFLARFKRRSSKEKSSNATEKSGSGKHRNSVLERSMSEHDSSKTAKEEKTSKLKVGRRRSSSFPNRFSYQESVDSSFESSNSELPNASNKRGGYTSVPKEAVEQGESSASVHDFSDESDVSPLVRRNKKTVPESQYTTIMLVSNSGTTVNPYDHNPSLECIKPLKEDSSKTDDEKLIEMMQHESRAKTAVVYQRSSSLELKKLNKSADHVQYLKVPKPSSGKERRRSFEKLFGLVSRNSSTPVAQKLSAQDISLPLSVISTSYSARNKSNSLPSTSFHLPLPESSHSQQSEDMPPSLPPKTKTYNSLLTPVSESGPSNSPFYSEPIYVEMDEVVSHLERGGNARHKTYPRSEKVRSLTDHKNSAETKIETKAGRESQHVTEERETYQKCQSDNLPVTISVDIPFADINEIEFESGDKSNLSLPQTYERLVSDELKVDTIVKCISPAKTVFRPRSGAEYAVIQRHPTSNAILGFPTMKKNSPHEHRVFNFDLQPSSKSPVSFNLNGSRHQTSPFYSVALPSAQETDHVSLSHSLCSVEAASQHSPCISITSKSQVSLPEKSSVWNSSSNIQFLQDNTLHVRPVVNTIPISPSPLAIQQAKSQITLHAVSPSQHQTNTDKDLFFFPIDQPSNLTPPPNQKSSQIFSSNVHSPIYVNQEFINKHYNNLPRKTSHGIVHASASPIRAGMQSLMSLFFKDSLSSKHNLPGEPQTVLYRRNSARSGLSESEAIKIEKKPSKINHSRSLTLPHSSKTNACLSLPGGLHSSQREVGCKDIQDQERSTLGSKSASQNMGRLKAKEYNNFADSSIISRRRLLQAQSEAGMLNTAQPKLDFFIKEGHPSHQNKLPTCAPKSSGYKNIDCFGAAVAISPNSMPSNLANAGHLLQPYKCLESHPNLHEQMPSVNDGHQISHGHNSQASTGKISPVLFPSSPPPPLPTRKRLPSSPPSPALSFEKTPSEISSDSPPSYYAPSPPSSPLAEDLPPLPPRRFPPGSHIMHTPSPLPLEPHPASPNSSEDLSQQELNYILVDMTDTPKPPEPHTPPVAFSRRSKRARRQKVEASAKSSYALIDFTVTKALQKTGQEHRDDSLRRASGHLNRMNSVPSSSGRKPLTLVSRERKLSSGSIESC
ncbi:protein dok-7 [Plakobranchus ocellatus]|uniref:Protein dok-7 n=1 Tax=Plakobranchus ocellatus TaxID=259542 RepID=A0AAV4DCS3_9GAST|nr:protein dok-7 [Plakobranchus ocellatus]